MFSLVVPTNKCSTAANRRPTGHTLNIRLIFAYNVSMFSTPSGRKTFVVTCKRCRRDVPSGRDEFPFQSITVECPLCSEVRQ